MGRPGCCYEPGKRECVGSRPGYEEEIERLNEIDGVSIDDANNVFLRNLYDKYVVPGTVGWEEEEKEVKVVELFDFVLIIRGCLA